MHSGRLEMVNFLKILVSHIFLFYISLVYEGTFILALIFLFIAEIILMLSRKDLLVSQLSV